MGALALVAALVWLAPSSRRRGAQPAIVDPSAFTGAVGSVARMDLTLRNLEGANITLASFKGKVILINFWALWCVPCRTEIPDLVALQADHPDDVVVLGAVVFDRFDARVKPFVEGLAVNYPILDATDRDDVEAAYGPLLALPTTVIIGRDGVIAARQSGAATRAKFDAYIKPLL